MKEALEWIIGNWLELAAASVSITYVILSIRQNKWLWWFGLASAILYAMVYGNSGFYAGMVLQGYYAVISLYGWWHWNRKDLEDVNSHKIPVTLLTLKTGLVLTVLFIILWITIYKLLIYFTDSIVPLWDALISAGGIVATWMLARKILQHWLLWIVIDLISIGVYAWQELFVTTLLFAIYVVTAVIGYIQWKKSMLQE